jgi:hypothetical protein
VRSGKPLRGFDDSINRYGHIMSLLKGSLTSGKTRHRLILFREVRIGNRNFNKKEQQSRETAMKIHNSAR